MSYNEPPPPPPSGGYGEPPQTGYGAAPQPPGGYGASQPPVYGQSQPQAGYGGPAGVPRPAELLNRFLARLIDHVLLGIVYVVLYVILSAVFLSGFSYSFGEQFLFYTLLSVLQAAGYLAYFAFMESSRGQTVGKMLMKLRTVGPDGASNPTMQQAVKRNIYSALGVLGIIPIIGWFFLGWAAPLAAVIFIAVTLNNDKPNHQGWHDKFAGGTRVLQVG